LLYVELQHAKNFVNEKPYISAQTFMEIFLATGNYHPDNILAALEKVTFEDFLAFHKILLQHIKFCWYLNFITIYFT